MHRKFIDSIPNKNNQIIKCYMKFDFKVFFLFTFYTNIYTHYRAYCLFQLKWWLPPKNLYLSLSVCLSVSLSLSHTHTHTLSHVCVYVCMYVASFWVHADPEVWMRSNMTKLLWNLANSIRNWSEHQDNLGYRQPKLA